MREALGAAIERLRGTARGVAWVAPENLHLTLKFLGSVDETGLAALTSALTSAVTGLAAFDAEVIGLGAFPTPAHPRVLWAGIADGAGALVDVAGRVEAALAALGFPPDERPFSPHVTLGRLREPRRDPALAEALAAGAGRAFGRTRVGRVSLMRSDLSPRGARYTELAGIALG
ncbi:MAG: RNA 2',3'-cyclic phosphodiesterase [Candidatus Rokubacteria bacterium]|nr:RNA 2',3'-cyclic phosphodiesterase [Candidatus Rokubacteria bacterium]